ncbi:MAG: FadR family transcriptional regulator [Aquisalinus sp.]|nr:FadR family transcriptional regulator [Aquisalinus sp.]
MADKRRYHEVAEQILQLIDSGVFPAGSRLPGERELAERFGVSRVTIREAEISLQAVGRIQIKTGSGVYVKDQDVGKDISFDAVTAFELTEARALFESEAAALAAPIIKDETLAELQRLVDEMSESGGGSDPLAEGADREFHLTIARATGNSAIVYVVESMWKMRTELPDVKRIYDSVCVDDASHRENEHQEILDALCSREPRAARNAMKEHFTRLLDAMLSISEQQAVEEVKRKASESRQRYLISSTLN